MAHHHYLPQSYLAGFTPSGSKDDFLHVFDLELCTVRRQRPIKIAFIKDLHRIDKPGVDPDLWENLLSTFETKVAEVIAEGEVNGYLCDESLNVLLNFIALTAIRVPRLRKAIETVVEQQLGVPFREAATRPEAWASLKRHLPNLKLGLSAEDIERLTSNPANASLCGQMFHLLSLYMSQDTLLGLLASRTWSLYFAEKTDGEFICSDNPVKCIHSPPILPYRPASFHEHDTIVSFPINRHVAMIGRFGGESVICEADRMLIATVNTQTLLDAWRCLYAPSNDFICLHADGGIGDSRHVFDHVVRG